MPNFKLTTSTYFAIFFFVLILAAIFTKELIFDFIVSQTGGSDQIAQSQAATKKTADLLLSLDKITLNTTILNSPYLQSLTQLPSYPIDAQTLSNFGKINPFIGNFIVVSTTATNTVGSVIYSNQREVNNNNSIRAVSATRR